MKKIFALIFCLSFSANSFAKDVWVAVSVYDGRNNGVNEYYGKIDSAKLDHLLSKADENAMFMISDTFWTDNEGNVVYMSDSKKYGRKYGYTNTVYFKESSIVRIVLLDESFIQSLLNKI